MNRRNAGSASPFEKTIGFSRAVQVGPWTLVSGTAPIDAAGHSVGVGDVSVQARRCFEIIRRALSDLDVPLADVVRTRMFLIDVADSEAVGAVHGEFFRGIAPAATMVVVKSLLRPEWLVEIEADAFSDER